MEEQQKFWVNWMVRRDNIRYKFGLPAIDVSQNFFASAGGLTALIYSVTHVTMWSLNVPLITWWRRSGDKSSWISARGNPYVKGCGYNFNSRFRKNKETHHYIGNYSIVIPKRVFPHRLKKCFSMSVSSLSSITMIKIFPVCVASRNLRHQN